MLELNIDSLAGKLTFFPAISNNLELPESERFAFELSHVSQFQITCNARQVEITEDGVRATSLDTQKYIKMHIKKIINPPTLKIDGGKKSELLTIDNLFTYPQLESVWDELSYQISKVKNVEGIKKN